MALIITSEEELNRIAPPALPQPTVQYSRQYQDQFNNVLRLYFNRITALQQQLSWAQPVDYIDFDTTPPAIPPAHQVGRVSWDVPDNCLEIDLEYGVVQQVGQETYARVSNETGITIPNGTVVGFAGATDDTLKVAPYLADGSQPTLYILGVMTHDLPDTGQKGYCTVWGFVRDVNTSSFTQGDVLYASPSVAGGFTNVKPTAPDNVVAVAAVVKVGTTDGVIFVRPTIMAQKYYGTFARTTDYAPAVANTAYAIPFDSTIISNGVSIGTPTSRIVVVESGFYSITCTLQYSSSNSSAKIAYAWLRKNGTDIAQSSRLVSVDTNGGYQLGVVAEPVSLAANDYIEVMVAVTNTAATLAAVGATAFAPGSPAANLTIQQIQE
jgi:hypothetical protein